jgi:hypothetical protein
MGGGNRAAAGDVRDFVKNPLLDGLILGQEPQRPSECDGGRFMAGGDESQEIVHDFRVAHAAPGFGIARGEQQIEKVRLRRRLCAPRLDQAAHVPM